MEWYLGVKVQIKTYLPRSISCNFGYLERKEQWVLIALCLFSLALEIDGSRPRVFCLLIILLTTERFKNPFNNG